MCSVTGYTDLAGGALKVGSSIAAGDTKAELQDQNAAIAATQARAEEESGAYNANLVRQRGAKAMGQQVSAIGANNLQQAGSPARVVADTARATELSALTTQNNALRKAWGFEVQGASDQEQAALDKQGGILSGIGSAISTAGAAYKDFSSPSG